MAKKISTRPQRMSKNFMDDLNNVFAERMFKKLATKKDLSFPAMTNLVTRTKSWQGVLFELKTKPKKEDLI